MEAYFDIAALAVRANELLTPLERLNLGEEMLDRPVQGARARTVARALHWVGIRYLGLGERSRAEAAWSRVEDLANRSHDASALLYPCS